MPSRTARALGGPGRQLPEQGRGSGCLLGPGSQVKVGDRIHALQCRAGRAPVTGWWVTEYHGLRTLIECSRFGDRTGLGSSGWRPRCLARTSSPLGRRSWCPRVAESTLLSFPPWDEVLLTEFQLSSLRGPSEMGEDGQQNNTARLAAMWAFRPRDLSRAAWSLSRRGRGRPHSVGRVHGAPPHPCSISHPIPGSEDSYPARTKRGALTSSLGTLM